jgi:hypothetical protein
VKASPKIMMMINDNNNNNNNGHEWESKVIWGGINGRGRRGIKAHYIFETIPGVGDGG